MNNCTVLQVFDGAFESGGTVATVPGGITATLSSARPKSEQGTAPEGVLDGVVQSLAKQAGCTNFTPEGYDDTPTDAY